MAPGCGKELVHPGDEVPEMRTISNVVEEAKEDEYDESAIDMNGSRIVRDADSNSFYTVCDYKDSLQVPPSAKVSMAMAVVFQWQIEAPDDKIIGKLISITWSSGRKGLQ